MIFTDDCLVSRATIPRDLMSKARRRLDDLFLSARLSSGCQGGGSCPLLPWGLEHFFLTLSHCCVGGQTSALMSDQALQIMNDMSQSDQSRPGGDVCLACCEVSVGFL